MSYFERLANAGAEQRCSAKLVSVALSLDITCRGKSDHSVVNQSNYGGDIIGKKGGLKNGPSTTGNKSGKGRSNR